MQQFEFEKAIQQYSALLVLYFFFLAGAISFDTGSDESPIYKYIR
jgi:hypothetical protein